MAATDPTRREFLQSTGALVVSFTLAGTAPVAAQTPAAPRAKTVAGDEVDAFLAIAPDGAVTVYSGKVDLGTGTRTALPQMAAEELDVAYERVALVEGDTALTPDQGPTWGSLTIQAGGVQIRQAAATARKALMDMASQRLGVPAADLIVRDGVVQAKADPARRVSYGELIGDRQFQLKLDKAAPLKDPGSYTIVGQSIRRVDIPAKVTGAFTYMQDVRVPGMVHARVVRPSAMGAALVSVDEGSVRGIKGLRQVVRVKDFLAVVADSEWAAVKAARQLKATWSAWEDLPDPAKIYEHVRATPIAADDVTVNTGDPRAAMGRSAKTLQATYAFAVQTHGSMGPSCAIADVRDGRATIWSASQSPHWLRRELAGLLGMEPARIRVIYADGAGCYGRNGHEDCAADAALLSREIGRPVRVQWTRADEHGWDPKGPPTLIDLRAGLDATGNVLAWESEFWIPQAVIADHPATLAATLAGVPQKDSINPGNVHRNSDPSYPFPHARAVAHRLRTTPFRPSWIRTPGRMQNTYANEAFLDELAAAAGVDPVEYRLRHLTDPRGIAVLKAAALRAGWRARPAPRRDRAGTGVARGRGVSYVKYENARTYVAGVAEVEVDRRSGAVRCTRFTVAHDCGLIINPDGVRAQLEGNVIQTVSRTLKEELRWDRSRVTSLDWITYPILRFPEVPVVDIELLSRPGDPPWGAGEPAAAIVPSALSNAVFDAIGVRLRTVPFTPERVKAALTA